MRIVLSSVHQIERTLLVDCNDETCVAHYTCPKVLFSLLKENSPFRLNVVDLTNDPSENKILNQWLNLNDSSNPDIKAFLASFTFNHCSLNQYRIYGLEDNKYGSGVNIEFGSDFFSRKKNKSSISDNVMNADQQNEMKNNQIFALPLYRCLYLNPNTGYMALAKRSKQSFYDKKEASSSTKIEKKYKKYLDMLNEEQKIITIRTELSKMQEAIQKMEENVAEPLSDLISLALMPISYLIKNAYYEDENECRIAYITTISDPEIISAEEYTQIGLFYVPYANISNYIKNINLGPQIDPKHILWLKNYLKKRGNKIKVTKANMPLK